MPNNFRAFHLLHLAYTGVFNAADKSLKKREGILTSHQLILFLLSQEDGLPSATVSERAKMSKSRLTGLANGLEDKGLIRRERGPDDGRQKLLFIEPEGRALIERSKVFVKQANSDLLEGFDENEREVIKRFLAHAAAT